MTAEPIEPARMQGWHTKDRTIMGPVLFAFLWPIWVGKRLATKLSNRAGQPDSQASPLIRVDKRNERSGL